MDTPGNPTTPGSMLYPNTTQNRYPGAVVGRGQNTPMQTPVAVGQPATSWPYLQQSFQSPYSYPPNAGFLPTQTQAQTPQYIARPVGQQPTRAATLNQTTPLAALAGGYSADAMLRQQQQQAAMRQQQPTQTANRTPPAVPAPQRRADELQQQNYISKGILVDKTVNSVETQFSSTILGRRVLAAALADRTDAAFPDWTKEWNGLDDALNSLLPYHILQEKPDPELARRPLDPEALNSRVADLLTRYETLLDSPLSPSDLLIARLVATDEINDFNTEKALLDQLRRPVYPSVATAQQPAAFPNRIAPQMAQSAVVRPPGFAPPL